MHLGTAACFLLVEQQEAINHLTQNMHYEDHPWRSLFHGSGAAHGHRTGA